MNTEGIRTLVSKDQVKNLLDALPIYHRIGLTLERKVQLGVIDYCLTFCILGGQVNSENALPHRGSIPTRTQQRHVFTVIVVTLKR